MENYDMHIDSPDSQLNDIVTPEITSEINTFTEIWALSKITRDITGDPIWEILYQMGYNPKPFGKIGYSFSYDGLHCIYFTKRKSSSLIRFAIPKVVSSQRLNNFFQKVNMANSLIKESKFTIMGGVAWLIYERYINEDENYPSLVHHILENLKTGIETFRNLS